MDAKHTAQLMNDTLAPHLKCFVICGVMNDGQKVMISRCGDQQEADELNAMAASMVITQQAEATKK